jgi:hypothetical protein
MGTRTISCDVEPEEREGLRKVSLLYPTSMRKYGLAYRTFIS